MQQNRSQNQTTNEDATDNIQINKEKIEKTEMDEPQLPCVNQNNSFVALTTHHQTQKQKHKKKRKKRTILLCAILRKKTQADATISKQKN